MEEIINIVSDCLLDADGVIESAFPFLDLHAFCITMFRESLGEEIIRVRMYVDFAVQERLQNVSLFDRDGKQVSVILYASLPSSG